jgi:DNA repair exonuclease SbcCD ATPase subunit
VSVKINKLEIENVKRVKAITLEPTANGLTIVGGKNNQGKTSVLDAIAWALGGDRFKPSNPEREGSATAPHLKVTLSNGLVVERKGAASALKVIDPRGNKGGQQLLNEFVEVLALDLPRFMESSSKDKAATLLKIIGVGDRLYELETEETRIYNKRRDVGVLRDQKQAAAAEMQSFPDAPSEPVTVSELIQQQQAILAKNGENQRLREQADALHSKHEALWNAIQEENEKLLRMEAELAQLADDLVTAEKSAQQLADESTAEIEASIANIGTINQKVYTNQQKAIADDEAVQYKADYDELTGKIEAVRAEKLALLDGADLPLEGLGVEAGELTFLGRQWDAMSGSEQLRVATAIVRKLNPECGFVLLDKLEQMDTDTLAEFGTWLESQELQVIATRVSTGSECEIVIEDGYALASDNTDATPSVAAPKKGRF